MRLTTILSDGTLYLSPISSVVNVFLKFKMVFQVSAQRFLYPEEQRRGQACLQGGKKADDLAAGIGKGK